MSDSRRQNASTSVPSNSSSPTIRQSSETSTVLLAGMSIPSALRPVSIHLSTCRRKFRRKRSDALRYVVSAGERDHISPSLLHCWIIHSLCILSKMCPVLRASRNISRETSPNESLIPIRVAEYLRGRFMLVQNIFITLTYYAGH